MAFTYAKAGEMSYDVVSRQSHPGHMFDVVDLATGAWPVDHNGEQYAIEEINTEAGWFLAYSNGRDMHDDRDHKVRVEHQRLELRPTHRTDP